jgi:hypothetical protein
LLAVLGAQFTTKKSKGVEETHIELGRAVELSKPLYCGIHLPRHALRRILYGYVRTGGFRASNVSPWSTSQHWSMVSLSVKYTRERGETDVSRLTGGKHKVRLLDMED